MQRFLLVALCFICSAFGSPYAVQKYFYSETCRGDNVMTYAWNTEGCAIKYDTIYYEYYSCSVGGDEIIQYYCLDNNCSENCVQQSTYEVGTCYDYGGGASYQFTCEDDYSNPSFDWIANSVYFKNVSCSGEPDYVKFEVANQCSLDDSYVQVTCQDGVPMSQVCNDDNCENCQDTVLGPFCYESVNEWMYYTCGEGSYASSLVINIAVTIAAVLALLI